MKKIVAKKLAWIIGTTMAIILLLSMLIQREEAFKNMEQNAKLVISQIDSILLRNEKEILMKNEVRYLLSQMPVAQGTSYYVVDKEKLTIIGATDVALLGKQIEEVLGKTVINWNKGVVVKSPDTGNYYYFLEKHNNFIGISQSQDLVFKNLRSNIGQLFVYLLIAAYIMITISMHAVDKLIIRSVDKVVEGVQSIARGELDTVIREDTTPEFKILSDNINYMTTSLVNHSVKISRILDAVDMLLAVYEYGQDSTKVVASGKIGAVLLLSEEETTKLLDSKERFEEKINQIKRYPVEGFKGVYRLPVETECYLQIETFQHQQTEFGVILDVTEQMIEKRRLQAERDSDLLTDLLTRRAFYSKMERMYENTKEFGNAVLLMCDLDGLKHFNDTYGHANGDKAIKKGAEILGSSGASNVVISRLSGDEYAVFIYGEESEEKLKTYIQNIYESMMQAKIEIHGKDIDVRLSGGYVFYQKFPERFDKLLKKADMALYESKKNGRARFTEYTE